MQIHHLGCRGSAGENSQPFQGIKAGADIPVICGTSVVERNNKHLDRMPFRGKQNIVISISDRPAQQLIEPVPALVRKDLDKTPACKMQ